MSLYEHTFRAGLHCLGFKSEIATILFGQLYKYSSTDANYGVLKTLLDNKTEFVIRVNKETFFFTTKQRIREGQKVFFSLLDCKKIF